MTPTFPGVDRVWFRAAAATLAPGEISAYTVCVDVGPKVFEIGGVAQYRGGWRTGGYWLAYLNRTPFQVLRHADVKTKPPISFRTRAEAADALVLHVAEHHPTMIGAA